MFFFFLFPLVYRLFPGADIIFIIAYYALLLLLLLFVGYLFRVCHRTRNTYARAQARTHIVRYIARAPVRYIKISVRMWYFIRTHHALAVQSFWVKNSTVGPRRKRFVCLFAGRVGRGGSGGRGGEKKTHTPTRKY